MIELMRIVADARRSRSPDGACGRRRHSAGSGMVSSRSEGCFWTSKDRFTDEQFWSRCDISNVHRIVQLSNAKAWTESSSHCIRIARKIQFTSILRIYYKYL